MAKYYKVVKGQNGRIMNTVEDVAPQNGKTFEYRELRAFVDGMVEIVPLPSGKSIVVNEEGKLDGLPYNLQASRVWNEEYPIEQYPHNNDQIIVGSALVCDSNEIE